MTADIATQHTQPGATAARMLRPLIQKWGGAFMTGEEIAEIGRDLGLPPHGLYLRGRSAVLGDPPAALVAELFGIFPRWLLDVALTGATVGAGRAVAAYQEANARWARAHLAGFAGADRLSCFLRRLVEAADASAFALFAGWQRAEWPSGEVERATHGLAVFREFRGGLHFAALRAVGLTPAEGAVADPEGGRARLLRTAWQPEAADELIARANAVPNLHARWRQAEALTDARVGEHLSATLDAAELRELTGLLRELDAAARS